MTVVFFYIHISEIFINLILILADLIKNANFTSQESNTYYWIEISELYVIKIRSSVKRWTDIDKI